MNTRRQLRDFVRLNPDEGPTVQNLGGGHFVPRSVAVVRELGTTAALALVDENHGDPQDRAAAISKRATLAQQRGQQREALLEWRFAALNPRSDLEPSRTDPDQHALTQRRERRLALGDRVARAEARETAAGPAWPRRWSAPAPSRPGAVPKTHGHLSGTLQRGHGQEPNADHDGQAPP